MNELPIINLDGIEIRPKGGVYRCPNKCGTKGYPSPKWKTEKGFRSHLDKCYMRPSEVLKRKSKKADQDECEKNRLEELAIVGKEKLKECPLSIGDAIYFVVSNETGPTHVQRGSRMVRVRYEAIISYHATCEIIERRLWNGSFIYNGRVSESELFGTYDQAKNEASRRTKGNVDYRKQCSDLR